MLNNVRKSREFATEQSKSGKGMITLVLLLVFASGVILF